MSEVLMPRDQKAIRFVGDFGLVSLSQLATVVYGPGKSAETVARRRLRILTEHKLLGRVRYGPNAEYVYYTGRRPPVRQEHAMQLVDVYVGLLRLGGQIERWEREPDWGSLRPDAYTVYWHNGRRIHMAIEINRDTNEFNQNKYDQDLALQKRAVQKRFPTYPRVLVVSERHFKPAPSEIRIVVIPPSLEGLDRIL